MKKQAYLTLVAIVVTCFTFVQAQNVVFETIYLNPKTESLQDLGVKMKAHNQKYHAAPPYRAGVYTVLTGERAGELLWIMGPFTFADLDKRPAGNGHDDDWAGNVLPLVHGMNNGYYWKLMPEFAYSPSENYIGKIMRVRTLDIKTGKMEEFNREMTMIMKVINENNLKNSFAVYSNFANDGDKDVAIVWQFDNYAAFDIDNEFSEKYEDMYGDNSWNEFQEAMMEIVEGSADELLERSVDMSAE